MSDLVREYAGVDPIDAIHVSGIAQCPDATYCPDCDRWVETALFVEHRELVHPPTHRALQVSGIASRETVGTPGR